MYPPKMNIIRHSKNIEKPREEIMRYDKAKEKVGCSEPTYKNCKIIFNQNFNNVIIYEQYNVLRSLKNNST